MNPVSRIHIVAVILLIGCLSYLAGCVDKPQVSIPEITLADKEIPTQYPTNTPIEATTSNQDPIIGVWRYNDSPGLDVRLRLSADGRIVSSGYEPTVAMTGDINGVWSANGKNLYTIHNDLNGHQSVFYLDTTRNAIYDTNYPTIFYVPYQGDVTVTKSVPNPPKYHIGDIIDASESDRETAFWVINRTSVNNSEKLKYLDKKMGKLIGYISYSDYRYKYYFTYVFQNENGDWEKIIFDNSSTIEEWKYTDWVDNFENPSVISHMKT